MKSFKIALFAMLTLFGTLANAQVPCVGGTAAGYDCDNVDLLSFTPLSAMGSTGANDIWGWKSTVTGKEYVLLGLLDATAFFDISNPVSPIYLGKLPTQTFNSTWRDIKTYNNQAYIVSEATNHGVQVFDLLQLDNVTNPPLTFSARSIFEDPAGGTYGTSGAHNIAINECSGYAYPIGAQACSGGLVALDLANPDNLTFEGCYSVDGYTHDAQCFNYIGPDAAYAGQEICLNSNENTLTVVDVTDKTNMTTLSITSYANFRYTHQGWATENQEYYLMNDEIDESTYSQNTRTHIWDIRDLDAPIYLGFFESANASTDHNLYIKGNRAYLSNYTSGLRIYDITNIATGTLSEVAYFDTYVPDNNVGYNGTWSNYPYFESGVIAVSGRTEGLFLLRYDLCGDGTLNCNGTSLVCGSSTCTPCSVSGCASVDLNMNFDGFPAQTSWEITNSSGDLVDWGNGTGQSNNANYTESSCLADGCYTITVRDAIGNGMCPFKATASSSGIFITPGTFVSAGNLVATLGSVVAPGLCGNFNLTDANGTLLTSGGGGFGATQTRTFCINGGLAPLTDTPDSSNSFTENNNSEEDFSMNVYPTIVNDFMTVEYRLKHTATTNIEVVDITGKVIFQEILNNNTTQISIDMSAFQAGFYFVRMNNGQDLLTQKIVKN